MPTKNFGITLLLIVITCVLAWNVTRPQPLVTAAPTPQPEPTGSITVSGSSAIRVQPDRIVVVLGVETFAKTPSMSRDQNARLSKKVLDVLRTHKIAERDIATAHFTIRPRYSDYDHHIISGYEARNTIAVTLRNVQKLEPVLVDTLEAGATTVEGIEFSTTDLRRLRDEARELAVQAALEKAAAIASTTGVALGNVTNIQENDWGHAYFGYRGSGRQWTNVQNVVQEMADQGTLLLEDGSISLGQIVIKAQVILTAELTSPR